MARRPDQQLVDAAGRAVRGVGRAGRDAAGFAVGAAGSVINTPFSLARRLVPRLSGGERRPPGSAPGIEQIDRQAAKADAASITIDWTRYDPERIERRDVGGDDLEAMLDQLVEPAKAGGDDGAVHWVTVRGLNAYLVDRFREKMELHTLAAEDVLVVPQLPKVEPFAGHLFIVARLVTTEGDRVSVEQISIFVVGRVVLVFQESAGDRFEGIRQRLDSGIARLRSGGPGYLLYALLDSIVDHGYPVLEQISDRLEALEQPILDRPTPEMLRDTHTLKRELTLIRRIIWPTRQMLETLRRDDAELLDESTRTFLRDVHDHAAQLLSIVEAQREVAGGLADLYLSSVSNRMNEAMRVLAVIATLFIPTSFLAGVYGMNFERLPGSDAAGGFWVFVGVCAAVVIGLLVLFRRKRWI